METLEKALLRASGSDARIDACIAKTFRVSKIDYSSDAMAARELVAQVLPQATLRVGYDVNGILPAASVLSGKLSHSAVAPTVPLAILRALLSAVSASA